MLHDHAGGGVERVDGLKRRVGVHDVVERQLLALHLLRVRHSAGRGCGVRYSAACWCGFSP